MAATDMKFGPEWLRALSDGVPNATTQTQTQTPPTTPAPPKYKLAEFRYGREEMLALFNHNCKPPEKLDEFPHIFVEKMQPPLALITMSEEESRLWSRVNSDVVLRLMGKSGTNGPERERGVSERGGLSIRAGRGSSLSERGRGRGRGSYYQRGTSYDDGGDSPPERRDFRTRTFERNTISIDDNTNSREKKYERTFVRGGGSGGGPDDNGLHSRKNLNSRSSSVENWRTAGRGEDREGWRTAIRPQETWNRSNSWRSGAEHYEHEGEHLERNGPQKKYTNYQKDKNSGDLWDDIEENDVRNSLPEWSLDDGPECDAKVGTFDASGAFREINKDEDETKTDNEEEEDKESDRKDASDEWTFVERNRKKSSQNTKQDNTEQEKEIKSENMSQNTEKPVKNIEKNNMIESTMKSSTHMSNNSQQQHQQKQQHQQQIHQQLPSQAFQQQSQPSSTTSSNTNNPLNKLLKTNDTSNQHNIKSRLEEDGFAHLEKEAENMVAQWTADEDQKEEPEIEGNNKNIIALPVQHEDAFKWFYRDPQGELQGPFTPHEMYDWFTAGYFAMDLLVRRGCDEVFSQLGELFKLWERIPFLQVQGSTPPPLRSQSSNTSLLSIPVSLSSSTSHSSPHNNPSHQHLLQQQFQQQQQPPQQQNIQYMNQHNVDMQSQLRQLLAQLKKQDGFSDLSQQQQQEVLVQQYVNMERKRQASLQSSSIPKTRSAEDSQLSSLDALSNLRIQGSRPLQMPNNSGHSQSIWDMNSGVMSVSAVEEMQRKEQERKELEEKRKALEEEHNRRKLEQEEIQRKLNEERERKYEELQKKLEEERLRNQELLRKQEEEIRRREEEERLRLEEEHNRLEEERRIVEEQRRRQEELMRLEEYARRQQQQEETERRRLLEAEKERQRLQLQELEQQRAKEMERIRQIQQQEAIIKLQHQQQEQNRKVWGGQEQTQRQQQQQQTPLSLNEIQKLQEEKERDERQRQLQIQQQQMQALFAAQQQQQQERREAANKQSLTWATPSYQQQNIPVKTLAEIQREEAEKVAKQKHVEHKKQQIQVTNSVPNAGIWNNANNQLFGQSTTGKPTNSTNSSAVGFWEPESRKVQTNRANESALHSMQSNIKGNNHSHFQTKANSRNKKEEETVLRLFENQRRQKTDEFTQWCNEALSKYQSSVDIPTFIAFLKDVESPFEINDYVRSYLGESKDVKDFAKLFIEKRSYFRNQAKKEASEELMWGPAPAITPSANKLTQSPLINQIVNCGDSEMSGFIQAGKKKKKGKRVIDNSILGFTVQADPDRINAGEIEQIDD